MPKTTLTWQDIEQECRIEYGIYLLGQARGARVFIPTELQRQAPYNTSIYQFFAALREQIKAFGIIEFPQFTFNKINYTLAQAAPWQHQYSHNPFMTSWWQEPHQDTPPYPTAFGLEEERSFFATWLMTEKVVRDYFSHPAATIEEKHRLLVPQSLAQGEAVLINQQAGLTLIDNSGDLYHARTCTMSTQNPHLNAEQDSPMYAFNEVGLAFYMQQLDSQRGDAFRDNEEQQRIKQRLEQGY